MVGTTATTATTPAFRTLAQVKAANRASDYDWFDPARMMFFNGVIESELIGSRYFVTSERSDVTLPKRYTVRMVSPDGSDITIEGQFQGYASKVEAVAAAEALVGQTLLA